jgi:hypothetical protein
MLLENKSIYPAPSECSPHLRAHHGRAIQLCRLGWDSKWTRRRNRFRQARLAGDRPGSEHDSQQLYSPLSDRHTSVSLASSNSNWLLGGFLGTKGREIIRPEASSSTCDAILLSPRSSPGDLTATSSAGKPFAVFCCRKRRDHRASRS